ncbi:MAG: sulfotransferase family 2 domain-containing protein [Bacillota bacterium]
MKNKYIFLHIPRTAGTSLFSMFYDILGFENAIWISDIDNFEPQHASLLEKFLLIGGHFMVSHQKKYFNDRYSILFLRNPVDRFISTYYYFKKYGNDEVVKNLDLISYLEFCRKLGCYPFTFFNNQTVYLTGVMDYSVPEKDLLDMAKENLSKMDFVGIYESLLDSVNLLLCDTKWPPAREIPFENASDTRPKLPEVDNNILERIGELNKIDMELYQYGVNLFNEKKRNILRECGR